MPEGPELHLASLFVNRICEGLVFAGAVEKSEVNKNPEVPFCCDNYFIKAKSRGKEVKLTLTPIKNDDKRNVRKSQSQDPIDVVFRFGMSGFFRFTSEDDLPKHAHLRFYTKENPRRVLSFVDPRRFGSWQPNGTWQKNRGPCVIFEYDSFRENVLSNISDKAFDKPICEALLNQKYFNGIGNYLRSEVLFRLQIPPFVKARTVLEGLELKEEDKKKIKKELTDRIGKKGVKADTHDILCLCHTVPLEVVNLGENGYAPAKGEFSVLQAWMQCYSVDGMNSLSDHNGRTVWFKGDPGPMVPKDAKSRKITWKAQKDDHDYTDSKKAKKTHSSNIPKEKPFKKKDNVKVKKETATSKTQRGSKRQTKVTKMAKAEVVDETKKLKSRGMRSPKVPRPGMNTIKGRLKEEEKEKRNSMTYRKRASKAAKPQQKRSGTRRGHSR